MDMEHTVPVPAYDVEAIRKDFPILSRTVYGKPLVYLDNGASGGYRRRCPCLCQ
jgi:cysteine desulfurase/selenocysteine lyase